MTLETLSTQTPPIPYDAFDLSTVIDPEKEVCERIYRWQEFEYNPQLPLLLIVIGGSRSGKDYIVNQLVEQEFLKRAKTATTKPVESHESIDGYIRMRQRKDGESQEEYYSNLIKEEDLIEYQQVHGFLYGLPRRSLLQIQQTDPNSVPVLIMEPNGAQTVSSILACEFNTMKVGIVPDNYEQIYRRSLESRTEEASIKRFYDSLEIYNGLKEIANFYIHNSELPGKNGASGAEVSVNSLKQLLTLYKS